MQEACVFDRYAASVDSLKWIKSYFCCSSSSESSSTYHGSVSQPTIIANNWTNCSMAKHDQPPNQGQQSVKIRTKPLKGPSCQAADFAFETDICILSGDDRHARQKSTYQSPNILSTAELISTVGRIWDCASSSLSRLQPKAPANQSEAIGQRDSESCNSLRSDNFGMLDLSVRCLHVDMKSCHCCASIVQQSLEILRPTHKITCIPCDDHFIKNVFPSDNHHSSTGHHMNLKEMGLASVRIPSSLAGSYGWMSQICQWPCPLLPSFCGSMKIIESFFSEASVNACCPASGNEVASSSTSQTPSFGLGTDMPVDLSSGVIADAKASVSSDSEHCLQTVENTLNAVIISTASSMGLHGDYQVSISASGSNSEPVHETGNKGSLENIVRQSEKLDTEAKLQNESHSSATKNPHPLRARQEHAVSGALAGIFVSLCLHPIDTIKTVIQSCRAGGHNSPCFMGQSIISERGLTGLYRGISSNITTSAPISAIYTFTYESVKGYLLPSLSKEHHAVAHCTAGACASIATSFIFTPSERIKQQMQVNSHYRNCWYASVAFVVLLASLLVVVIIPDGCSLSAVFKIMESGGLLSLYTGWGAVLCRNIPHSIVKFYTYESLKQMFMSPPQSSKQPTTLQTLLCGGLAGSTAALVSTPFDVVKTRLQTQLNSPLYLGETMVQLSFFPPCFCNAMYGSLVETNDFVTQVPGSVRRYHSILNALKEIRECEGVKGLYRGLIPRFVMYMSQGALFFASYEFFKSVLSLQLPQHKTESLQYKQDADDDPLLPL
ncbi:hypothetical protein Cgig2_002381 [Carnegiea gigantea]|uniref:Mitochondrial carrier protein n=1 Tax=Carnegiea gigantea TaxID=171969 RepID=A0A9Q1QPD9_9CARY|nr:hypothetical protein Cgig2_002381 [Carnegiea gigantea]